jgi:predicted dehydrogenase
MLRLGIIGCGRVTTMFHLKAINSLDRLRVSSVADLDARRRTDVMRRTKADQGYSDYLDLLSDPHVDVVAINTPPRFHEEMTLNSLKHGKNVLCEKPLAQSIKGCENIKEMRRNTSLTVLPGHNYVFTPSLEKMRNLVMEGEIGEIEKVKVSFLNNLRSYRSHSDFRLEKHNGMIEDVLPHALSVAKPFTGSVVDIGELSWSQENYEICDNLDVNFDTTKSVTLECKLSWTSLIPKFKFTALGFEGRLETDLMLHPYKVKMVNGNGTRTFDSRGWGWYLDLIKFKHPSFENQYNHLINLIEGKEIEPRITIEDEISIIEAIDQVSEYLK